MIKKNTKVIFENDENSRTDELVGGMPLSIGDTVQVHRDNLNVVDYEVIDKKVDCYLGGEDQEVNITYRLRRVN
ncbi:MAG: hypothetical protein ABIC57_00980 [bacterium]